MPERINSLFEAEQFFNIRIRIQFIYGFPMKSNTNFVSATLFLLPIFVLVNSYCHAQEEIGLSLEINIPQDSIGPIEPLRFQLAIKNEGENDLSDLAPWAFPDSTEIVFAFPGSSEWKQVPIPFFYRYATNYPLGGIKNPDLKSGQIISSEIVVHYDKHLSYKEKRVIYHFSEYGEYAIRAKYEPSRGK